MKNVGIAAALLLLAVAPVHAAKSAQQELMTTCNAEAKGKSGEDRKAFMKDCLGDSQKRQQAKMKVCNVENKGKKGDERKAAMKECLSK